MVFLPLSLSLCVCVCARVCVFVRVGGWACACVGGERFSNSNRIIPSDYRILLLLKMPIPNMNCMVWGDRLGRTQTDTLRCARRVQK